MGFGNVALRRGCARAHLASEPRARQQQVGCRLAVADAIGVPCRLSRSGCFFTYLLTFANNSRSTGPRSQGSAR